MLVQTLSRIYAFYRVRGHIITKCPHIDSEVKDGFVKHMGQHGTTNVRHRFCKTTTNERTSPQQFLKQVTKN